MKEKVIVGLCLVVLVQISNIGYKLAVSGNEFNLSLFIAYSVGCLIAPFLFNWSKFSESKSIVTGIILGGSASIFALIISSFVFFILSLFVLETGDLDFITGALLLVMSSVEVFSGVALLFVSLSCLLIPFLLKGIIKDTDDSSLKVS